MAAEVPASDPKEGTLNGFAPRGLSAGWAESILALVQKASLDAGLATTGDFLTEATPTLETAGGGAARSVTTPAAALDEDESMARREAKRKIAPLVTPHALLDRPIAPLEQIKPMLVAA